MVWDMMMLVWHHPLPLSHGTILFTSEGEVRSFTMEGDKQIQDFLAATDPLVDVKSIWFVILEENNRTE